MYIKDKIVLILYVEKHPTSPSVEGLAQDDIQNSYS